MNKIRKSTIIFVSLLFLSTIVFGVALGWGLSETKNVIIEFVSCVKEF